MICIEFNEFLIITKINDYEQFICHHFVIALNYFKKNLRSIVQIYFYVKQSLNYCYFYFQNIL